MSSKVQELLRDYFATKEATLHAQVLNNYTGILLCGVGLGVVLSYTSLVPLGVGFALGFLASRKLQGSVVDAAVIDGLVRTARVVAGMLGTGGGKLAPAS